MVSQAPRTGRVSGQLFQKTQSGPGLRVGGPVDLDLRPETFLHDWVQTWRKDRRGILLPTRKDTSLMMTVSHIHVFLECQDNETKHDYYTPQEILDGTEQHIKEVMRTTHKNHVDRHKEYQESGGDPVDKRQKQQSLLNFTSRSGGAAVTSFVAVCSQPGPASGVGDVSMEQVIREEMDTYQIKTWTVRLPDPTRSQACEVCTLEDPDERWVYQRKIGNSFPLLYEVWKCVSSRPMSSDRLSATLARHPMF